MNPAQPSAETVKRLKYYPDYVDDPDGLERFRDAVKRNGGHDMAAVNHNSLGRLIDTIERLRRERDKARLAHSTPPASDVIERAVAAETERCARIADAVANRPVQAPEQGVWERAERVTGRTLAAAIRRSQPASDEGDAA